MYKGFLCNVPQTVQFGNQPLLNEYYLLTFRLQGYLKISTHLICCVRCFISNKMHSESSADAKAGMYYAAFLLKEAESVGCGEKSLLIPEPLCKKT